MSTEQRIGEVPDPMATSSDSDHGGGKPVDASGTGTGHLDTPIPTSFFARTGDNHDQRSVEVAQTRTRKGVKQVQSGIRGPSRRQSSESTQRHGVENSRVENSSAKSSSTENSRVKKSRVKSDSDKKNRVSGRKNKTVLKARRVERVISRINVWSLLRVSAFFYFCLWIVLMISGLILWRAASSMGLINNIESFVAELLAEESVNIDGGKVFRASLVAGLVLVVATTAFTGLLAIMFNLISAMVGGIRVGVIEMETARPVMNANTRHSRSE